jgi:hypothetical protein
MTKIERGVDRVAIRQNRGHRIAEKADIDDVPTAIAARDLEQPLAGSDVQSIRHIVHLLS